MCSVELRQLSLYLQDENRFHSPACKSRWPLDWRVKLGGQTASRKRLKEMKILLDEILFIFFSKMWFALILPEQERILDIVHATWKIFLCNWVIQRAIGGPLLLDITLLCLFTYLLCWSYKKALKPNEERLQLAIHHFEVTFLSLPPHT